MKNNEFANQTTEQLKKRKRTTEQLTAFLAGVLLVLLIVTLYQTITDEFTYLLIVPLALSPILFNNYSTLNKISKELKSREP